MIAVARELVRYRELMLTLAWKSIVVRYKQAYLGVAWAVLKPLMLLVIFVIVRSFIGIDSGPVPYPLLTFAALMMWMLFQEAVTDCTTSIVTHAAIVRKVYFPREVFPLTSALTKLVEFGINWLVLLLLLAWYGVGPTIQWLWIPVLVVYALAAALAVGLATAAANVYFRDVQSLLPVALSLLMYLSPVIYPLDLVRRRLVEQQAAGEWSELLFRLYTANPLAGIIDGFQRAVLKGLAPDLDVIWPGLVTTVVLLPLSYRFFKRAEARFADVI